MQRRIPFREILDRRLDYAVSEHRTRLVLVGAVPAARHLRVAERVRFQQPQNIRVAALRRKGFRDHIFEVDEPRSVCLQVANRDRLGGLRQRRQPLVTAVIERYSAVLGQQQDARGGELLRDRCER